MIVTGTQYGPYAADVAAILAKAKELCADRYPFNATIIGVNDEPLVRRYKESGPMEFGYACELDASIPSGELISASIYEALKGILEEASYGSGYKVAPESPATFTLEKYDGEKLLVRVEVLFYVLSRGEADDSMSYLALQEGMARLLPFASPISRIHFQTYPLNYDVPVVEDEYIKRCQDHPEKPIFASYLSTLERYYDRYGD